MIDLLPWPYTTRARKIAKSLRTLGEVDFISLAEAGRFGVRFQPGEKILDGVRTFTVNNRAVNTKRTLVATFQNLLTSYVPGILRMLRRIWRTPADLVVVDAHTLLLAGVLHKAKWNSRIVFDARERPGAIRTRGSLATWFSRIEPVLFPRLAPKVDICLSVCETHAADYRALGFERVVVVRNIPELMPPPLVAAERDNSELLVAYVGSLYPGRGLELLLDGVAKSFSVGCHVNLEITGWGSADYLAHLDARVARLGIGSYVSFLGACDYEEVRERYGRAHVACVLYEHTDAANDSLSNKLFEAMSCGCCILATDQPETSALVKAYRCGVVVPPTAMDLSKGLNWLLQNRPVMLEMGRNAMHATQAELHWQTEVKPFLDFVDTWRH